METSDSVVSGGPKKRKKSQSGIDVESVSRSVRANSLQPGGL